MNQRQILTIVIFLAIGTAAAAQYDPAPGSDDWYELSSPTALATRGALSLSDGPAATALNPAAVGFTQRPGIDLNYSALVDFGGEGWGANAFSTSIAIPTAYGVFGGGIHLLRSALTDLPIGTIFALDAIAAKDLYPELSAGVSLRTLFGRADEFDIGVAANLGLFGTPGTVGRLSNVRWGFVLQNAGRWMTPVADASAIPAPFTPQATLQFDPLDRERIGITTGAVIGFPSFQNVRGSLAGSIVLFDTVQIDLGWGADLRQLLDSELPRRSLLPTVGVQARFTVGSDESEGLIAERGWQRSELTASTAAAPLYGGVWAFSAGARASLGMLDFAAPNITLGGPRTLYISPNNDGRRDAAVYPLSITDDRYVASWRAIITDENRSRVALIEQKDERPENRGFQNLADRILSVDTGVPVAPEIRWGGVSDAGERVADGRYYLYVEAWDDNGNSRRTEEYMIVVDTQPPSVTLALDAARTSSSQPVIFSPNGDGNKDSLRIEQSGSTEDRWSASFVNVLGNAVLTRRWEATSPQSFTWEGRSDGGETVPDGVYRYQITAEDRAGNVTTRTIDNIVVDTATTPIELDLSHATFSPNGDGSNDSVTYTPRVPITRGLQRWTVTIEDAEGNAVRTFTDVRTMPSSISWNGTDDRRRRLAEGVYSARLVITYENGNQPSAQAPPVTIDLTPPSANVRVDEPVFSPNSDGVKDSVTVYQEASPEERWTGSVRNAAGSLVRTYTWPTRPEPTIQWDGRDDQGRFVPDGSYVYTLEATDRAGNRTTSRPATITLDTSQTPVLIRAEYSAFSPNSDGTKDRQSLALRAESAEISSYWIEIRDLEDTVVRRYEGGVTLEERVIWDGTTDEGRTVADGPYRAALSVTYANGNTSSAQSSVFQVDTTAPQVSLAAEYLLFSPDGDGRRDSIELRQETSRESLWTGTLVGPDGRTVRSNLWRGTATSVQWNGTDEAGNRVPDGQYRYRVSASDAAGNYAERTVEGITVDTRSTRLFVTTSARSFSPNGDGVRDDFELSVFTSLTDGATSWSLDILDGGGEVVRSFTGTQPDSSRTFSWNGRGRTGGVREGQFVARYRVEYEKGNAPSATSSPFIVDLSAPAVSVELAPTPFSPDNDGIDDELRIGIDVVEATEVQAWRLEILDRNGRFFTEFVGRGAPADELVWDGRAADGELVISAEDYPYELTIGDVVGNVTTTRGVIPVDILVVRDGDRLKVQIPSITFEPDSPILVTDPTDPRGEKNAAILARLAEIFIKYGNYNVQIEGHAVNISGTQREEREELIPLSTERAQSVKDALVELGMAARRVSVVGRGGSEPVVPHTDMDNRWKNRRVEFVLIR